MIDSFCRSDGGASSSGPLGDRAGQPITTLPPEKFASPAPAATCFPLLCHEACNLLVAKAREVVKRAERPDMILRARTLVTMAGPPIEHGAVAVEGNRIVAVGHVPDLAWVYRRAESIDLGDVALLPGLINAHCHLDYTMMRHAISPPKSFTAWVQRINALKRSLDSDDYLAAIRRGFAELKKWGTTAVCNLEAFPELMVKLPPSPIRTWWFYEMIDIRHRITTDDVVAGALSFFQHRGNSLDHFGLSPHAPYTASISLYQLANSCAQAFTMPLTTHVAESREEFADVSARRAGRSTSS